MVSYVQLNFTNPFQKRTTTSKKTCNLCLFKTIVFSFKNYFKDK